MEASDQEMCDKLESAILEDRRTKVSVLAHELGISEGTVIRIIREKLHMSKGEFSMGPKNADSSSEEEQI